MVVADIGNEILGLLNEGDLLLMRTDGVGKADMLQLVINGEQSGIQRVRVCKTPVLRNRSNKVDSPAGSTLSLLPRTSRRAHHDNTIFQQASPVKPVRAPTCETSAVNRRCMPTYLTISRTI